MKTIVKIFTGVSLIGLIFACNKEDKLNYTLQNYDTFVPGAIDEWITKNLTDPYNIEVVYRYQRNMHDINKNISPADESKVIPQMDIVKKGFLEVYNKIGGATFIKTYTPKQFALFGSGDYDPDGSVKGGTADGGRRITLYGLNGLNENNPNSVVGNLQVIHHEFTHILNQTRFIPVDFEKVCVGDYYSNWTAQENTPAAARALGFITPYARKNIGEDFAETLSHLIVGGQLYYDQFAYQSDSIPYVKLKQKETIVRDYMIKYFNIDVTQLQMEFQRVMEEQYKSQSYSFLTAVTNKTITETIDMDIRSSWGQENVLSPKQIELFTPILDGFGSYQVKGVRLKMLSASKMTLSIPFGNNTDTWNALYDLDIIKIDNESYKIKLSAVQGADAGYGYGNFSYVISDVKPLLNYLESTSFKFSWSINGVQTPLNYLKFVNIQDLANPQFGLTGKVSIIKY